MPRPARLRLAIGGGAAALLAAAVLVPHGDGSTAATDPDAVRVVGGGAEPGRAALPVSATAAAAVADDGKPALALLRQAPDPVVARHAAIETGPPDDALATRAQGVIESRLGAAAAMRFHGVSVACSGERCEVRGTASGDEVAARLAMREGNFLDALSGAGCFTDMDMVSPGADGAQFVLYLNCSH